MLCVFLCIEYGDTQRAELQKRDMMGLGKGINVANLHV